MFKKLAIALTALTFTLAFAGCGGEKKTAEAKDVKPAATTAAVNFIKPEVNNKPLRFLTEDKNAPVVYFTKDVSAGGLMKVYKALGQEKKGKVAVKVSFGAEGEQYLDPILMAELMKETQGTFVDTNGFRGTVPGSDTDGGTDEGDAGHICGYQRLHCAPQYNERKLRHGGKARLYQSRAGRRAGCGRGY